MKGNGKTRRVLLISNSTLYGSGYLDHRHRAGAIQEGAEPRGLFAPAGALGSFLDTAGTVLLLLPLPLLALGAFCLDLLEKKPPALPLPAEVRPAVPSRRHRLRPRRPHHN